MSSMRSQEPCSSSLAALAPCAGTCSAAQADQGLLRHTKLVQEFGIVGYTMNLSMIEYKTLIIREELEAAAALLPSIPKVTMGSQSGICGGTAPPGQPHVSA